jgi:hypothetical protein
MNKRSNKRSATVNQADLLLQPVNNMIIRRNLQGIGSASSDTSGNIQLALDLTIPLTASSDWGNLIGAFSQIAIYRVHVQIIPYIFFHATVASNIYQHCDYQFAYSPSSTAISTGGVSQYSVLNCAASSWVTADLPHTLSFTPVMSMGGNNKFYSINLAAGALESATGDLFMGQFLINSAGGFPASQSPALGLRFIYECAFKAAQ